MCYTHNDNNYTGGRLTAFADKLKGEVRLLYGRDFEIFVDHQSIRWGQDWRVTINNAIHNVMFFIPVITPGFFNSDECRRELRLFIRQETRLGRGDLILPLLYVETPVLVQPVLRNADELARVIERRQFRDWRATRFARPNSPGISNLFTQLATEIRDVLLNNPPTLPDAAAAGRKAGKKSAKRAAKNGGQAAKAPAGGAARKRGAAGAKARRNR